jgi:hypothetical protein
MKSAVGAWQQCKLCNATLVGFSGWGKIGRVAKMPLRQRFRRKA